MMLAETNTLVLIVILTLSLFSSALLLFWTWLNNRTEALPVYGAAAYVASGCGVALIGARAILPGALTIVGGNLGLIIGSCLLYGGLRVFNGGRFPTLFATTVPLVFLALLVLWPVVYVDAAVRFSLAALLVTMGYAMSVYETVRVRDGLRSRLPLALALALQGGMAFARIPLSFYADPPISSYSGAWFAGIVIEAVVFAQVVSYLVISLPKERVEHALHRAAHSDSLTGLQNRRAFYDCAQSVISHASRRRKSVAVVSFDLDHFKQLNDTYGHAAGDVALRCFAEVLAANLRSSDICARLGGEEFVALMCETSEADARQAAERVVAAFARLPIAVGAAQIRATVSAGTAGSEDGTATLEMLLAAADRALYAAKQSGRNRVVGLMDPSPALAV
jgi:diguanylate cyclase (GGDEF)-like protein